jgi:hypothetical protein
VFLALNKSLSSVFQQNYVGLNWKFPKVAIGLLSSLILYVLNPNSMVKLFPSPRLIGDLRIGVS